MFLLKELQCNVRIHAGYLRLLHSFLCSEARTASVLDKELFTSGLALGISELGVRKTCWARLKTKLRPVNKGLSEESRAVNSDQLITALRHSRIAAFARLGHRAGLFLLPRTHDICRATSSGQPSRIFSKTLLRSRVTCFRSKYKHNYGLRVAAAGSTKASTSSRAQRGLNYTQSDKFSQITGPIHF